MLRVRALPPKTDITLKEFCISGRYRRMSPAHRIRLDYGEIGMEFMKMLTSRGPKIKWGWGPRSFHPG